MKKSKKSSEEPRDRLSELPDSLIFEIFWFLPMKEVVQTTILSKRWNNLWKTTPCLNFDLQAPKFVNRALIFWKGLNILKFRFSRGYASIHTKSVFSDLDVWVSLAKENRVEEVYLENIYIYNNGYDKSYCAPRSLWSCSCLKVLSLRKCNLQIHGNVQLNLLRSLTIVYCNHDEHLIDQVVSGSPQLEVCILKIPYGCKNLSIRSTSLKTLSIASFQDHAVFNDSELRICSPNLETCDFIGYPYARYSLENVSSLADLTLGFGYETCKEDILGEILWQIFPTIQCVEKLKLSRWCIKVLLGAMKDKHSISPSLNLKSLTINEIDAGYYEQILDILQIFPKLETLVLQCSLFYKTNHATSFIDYERNLPESFLLQLRTVEITLTKVDNQIIPFVEILLKHASMLQKMAILVRGIKRPSKPLYLELKQKLLRMPRSSPTAVCRIDFC